MTSVEWLVRKLSTELIGEIPLHRWDEIRNAVQQALEMERQQTIDFVEWLTRYDSPYAIMWGNEPERFCTENKDFTIEQVYEEYLKQKEK